MEKLTDEQVAALVEGAVFAAKNDDTFVHMRHPEHGLETLVAAPYVLALALEVQQSRLKRKVLGVLLVNGADAGVSKEALLAALRLTLDEPDWSCADFTAK